MGRVIRPPRGAATDSSRRRTAARSTSTPTACSDGGFGQLHVGREVTSSEEQGKRRARRRAYWDGTSLISRLGNRFHAPDWFLEGLPEIPLDGELWIGRKAFQRTVGIVRRQDKTDLWKEVRYVAFDAPGVDAAFEGRLAAIRAHVDRDGRRTCPPTSMRCAPGWTTSAPSCPHRGARRRGADGPPAGIAIRGRPVAHPAEDQDLPRRRGARAGHLKGAGRHKGRLGALFVELADGTQFSVGTGFSDAEREAPPPVGSLITFRYQELSDGGVPRFPSYVGVRVDAAWPSTTPTYPRRLEKTGSAPTS